MGERDGAGVLVELTVGEEGGSSDTDEGCGLDTSLSQTPVGVAEGGGLLDTLGVVFGVLEAEGVRWTDLLGVAVGLDVFVGVQLINYPILLM